MQVDICNKYPSTCNMSFLSGLSSPTILRAALREGSLTERTYFVSIFVSPALSSVLDIVTSKCTYSELFE